MNPRILLVAAAVLALGMGVANAKTDDDARIAKLEETVRLLQERVASLESQLREQSAPVSVPAGKESWRKLHNGMKQAEVE